VAGLGGLAVTLLGVGMSLQVAGAAFTVMKLGAVGALGSITKVLGLVLSPLGQIVIIAYALYRNWDRVKTLWASVSSMKFGVVLGSMGKLGQVVALISSAFAAVKLSMVSLNLAGMLLRMVPGVGLIMGGVGAIAGFLFSWVGILAIIGGALLYFLAPLDEIQAYFTGIWNELQQLFAPLKQLGAVLALAVAGIKAAFATGEFKLLGEILFKTLQIVWKVGCLTLLEIWQSELMEPVRKSLDEIKEGFASTQGWLAEKMIELGIIGSGDKQEDLQNLKEDNEVRADERTKKRLGADEAAKAEMLLLEAEIAKLKQEQQQLVGQAMAGADVAGLKAQEEAAQREHEKRAALNKWAPEAEAGAAESTNRDEDNAAKLRYSQESVRAIALAIGGSNAVDMSAKQTKLQGEIKAGIETGNKTLEDVKKELKRNPVVRVGRDA
jgi:hypothetical protein